MKLQVMICTYGNLDKVSQMQLPRVDEVGYLISCQSVPCELPASLQRDDVKVVFTGTIGLSNNRNNAIDHATAPYGLIADDDLMFDAAGLKMIWETFDRHPNLAVAAFKAEIAGHVHPQCEWDLWKPYKNYNVASVEIALNLAIIKQYGLRFNPEFGVGAKRFKCAEENIFLLNVEMRGLNGRYFPIAICSHPQESTGTRSQSDAGVLQAQGVYIGLKYGSTKIPRLLLKAKRTRGNFFKNVWHLCQGAIYAALHRSHLLG